MKKCIAFTLAETLIVMGVIGVVAALTLPNLNSSTSNKEKVAKVQKIYQNLNDAIGRAEAVYGPYDEWFVNDGNDAAAKAKRTGERISEFMKLSKECKMATGQKCFSNSTDNAANYYKIITADGTSIAFAQNEIVEIDLDGPTKGSNKNGVDIFDSVLSYNSSKRAFLPGCGEGQGFSSITYELFENPNKCGFSWIVNVGNMDYLKAGTDGKCKNNTSITLDGVSNTTCK